ELAAAQAEHATLTARIEGLRAQEAALRQAIAAEPGHTRREDIVRMTKSDAIVALVDHPMRIPEVVTALHAAGRPQETYQGVSLYLVDLVTRKRLARLSHGVYGPAA